jgi:hypothetical protein
MSGQYPAQLRRALPWAVLGLLLLGAVLLGLLGRQDSDARPLSPANPAPGGAQAVAEVLRAQGVQVKVPGSLEEAGTALRAVAGSTLLLHDPDGWLDSVRLAELEGLAGRLVLVEPGLVQLEALAPGITAAGLVPEDAGEQLAARCTLTAAGAAGSISAGGLAYRGPLVCFPVQGPAQLAAAGSYVATEADAVSGGQVVVLGNSAVLANGTAAEHGNAALALRALGSAPQLVWYQPTAADLALGSGRGDPLALLPEWVNPLLLWLLVTALLAAAWRARRLGPLVPEPLPVVVRAAETADGRARLYQAAGAVDRAAANLRSAALARTARKLGLPAGTSAGAVVDAAARHTGRPRQEVEAVLDRYTPTNDAELVRWSRELDQLEEEISP